MQVDFSHAIIEPVDEITQNLTYMPYFSLAGAGTSANFGNTGSNGVNFGIDGNTTTGTDQLCNQILTGCITNITENGFKVIYDGSFKTGGTAFTITSGVNERRYWRISNIHFSAGDTFHFQIDVNLS